MIPRQGPIEREVERGGGGGGEGEGEIRRIGKIFLDFSSFFRLPSSDEPRTDIRYILYSARCRTSFFLLKKIPLAAFDLAVFPGKTGFIDRLSPSFISL